MYKTFTTLLLCLTALFSNAQNQAPGAQPYGKIDLTDLQLKECDFEKDANAEILFDIGNAGYDGNLDLSMSRHKRIKIFNLKGKDAADIRIEYYSGNHYEYITGLQAQTINLVDGKPEITKLDKKQIFTEQIDKQRSALVFSMPNVKEGSIIEIKYTWSTNSLNNFPEWYFQDKLPTRYSEFKTYIPDFLIFKLKSNVMQEMARFETKSDGRSTGTGNNVITYALESTLRALANIPSLPDEPYMTSKNDNLQSITHMLTSIRPMGIYSPSFSDSWAKVGRLLAEDEDFGMQLKRKLAGEDELIAKAKALKTDNQKIQYLFNEVKNTIKWNGVDRWYTNDGTVKAWERKTGNSAEVNLILYHLLKKTGITAYPMVASTRSHGRVISYFTFLRQFNRAVVYIPVDSVKSYVLDATNKYNAYNEIPDNLLNSDALYIDKENEKYDIVFLEKRDPVRQVIFINGQIKENGKLEGNAEINNFSYLRIGELTRYKDDGEQKYIDYLKNKNTDLKISALKLENIETDTLPLKEHITFNIEPNASESGYLYISPNMFSYLRNNPFLSEKRRTDVDFGYINAYTIICNYNLPANYTVDALPKNITMTMPDGSLTFKRFLSVDNGKLAVRYQIDHRAISYPKDSYPEFFEFYKKMYEMLNEQIVLKKS